MQVTIWASAASLRDYLQHTSQEALEKKVGRSTYYKALQWYQEDEVQDISLHSDTSVSAVVRHQPITLSFENGDVVVNLPAEAEATHAAAAIIAMQEDGWYEQLPDQKNPGDERLLAHLQSLSKEELIMLVKRFAPAGWEG